MTTAHIDEHAEIPPPKVEEVSPGIFGYIQLDGSWGLNNTGFIVGSAAVTIIDSCFTEKRSRWFRDAVRRTAGDKAIRTLVNTHHHGDHTHGNYVFLPAATIIGHHLCREEVIATQLGTKGMFPGVDWGEIIVAPPAVTFEERLDLYIDDLKVELIFVGPAHTTNDIVAWIPERKVLFAGDIVFNEGTPFAMMGSIAGWLEALERDYSHPSLIGWCPVNESWQPLSDRITSLDDATRALYLATKAMDRTRPVLDASGYSHRVPEVDIYDSHDYEQDPAKFAAQHAGLAQGKPFANTHGDQPISFPYKGQPYFVSEFGGTWWNPEARSGEDSWGYGLRPMTIEDFYTRFTALTGTLLDNPHMFGYAYTQLTDVFQEQNGIYTFDRLREICRCPACSGTAPG